MSLFLPQLYGGNQRVGGVYCLHIILRISNYNSLSGPKNLRGELTKGFKEAGRMTFIYLNHSHFQTTVNSWQNLFMCNILNTWYMANFVKYFTR